MAVARASSAESIRTGTEDPYTFNFTPAGTPRGIVIGIVHRGTTPLVTGMTYGGVTMTEVTYSSGTGIDTAGEDGLVRFWELLSNIPTGTQTVSATGQGSSTTDIVFVVWELSSSGNVLVREMAQAIQGDQANPTVDQLVFSGLVKQTLCMMYGGGSAPGGTLAAGNTLDHTHDLGNFYAQSCYETTPDNANHTIGWSTLGSDDVALGAVSYYEAPAIDQAAFRGRNDDGSESTATWIAAENTPFSVNIGDTFRLRFAIQNDESSALNNVQFSLRGSINGGTQFTVGLGTTADIRVTTSTNVTDQEATTEQLIAGTGTFEPGVVSEATVAGGGNEIDIPANGFTEVEWVIQTRYDGTTSNIQAGDVCTFEVWTVTPGAALATASSGSCDVTLVGFPHRFMAGYPPGTGLGIHQCGPFKSSGGNFYAVLPSGNVTEFDEMLVWKRTPSGNWGTVASLDSVNGNPIASSTEGGVHFHATAQDGDNLHIVWASAVDLGVDGTCGINYALFDMSDDTQTGSTEEIEETLAQVKPMAMRVRTDGSIVVVYIHSTVSQVASPTVRAIYGSAGSFTAIRIDDDTISDPGAATLTIDESNDDAHIFWWTDGASNTGDMYHRVLDTGGGLSTRDVVVENDGSGDGFRQAGFMYGAVIFDNDLFALQIDPPTVTLDIRVWQGSLADDPSDWASTGLTTDAETIQQGNCISAVLLTAGGRLFAFWIDETDNEIVYKEYTTGGGWGSETSTNIAVLNDGAFIAQLYVESGDVILRGFETDNIAPNTYDVNDYAHAVDFEFNLGAEAGGGGGGTTFSGWWGFIQGW